MKVSDLSPAPPVRVTTFELFFDLVFVLTITRLTEVLHHGPDVVGLLTMFLILANIWWMYTAFSYLTNNIGTSSLLSRSMLLIAMGGFLVMALATPHAFGEDGLAFGIAYLVVVVVHLVMFRMGFERGVAQAMRQIAAYNLGSAVLLVIAGFVEGPADWWLWGAAAALHVGLLELGRYSSFSLWPNHFVERNGIVLIVALGESMVALGLGIGNRVLTPSLIVAALLGLGLAATLWTLYFAEADTASDRALQGAPRERVVRLAGLAFGYAFVPILGGIVMISAGLVDVLEHPLDHIPLTAAVLLAGGASIYVAGLAAFRQAVSAGSAAIWLDSTVAITACAATTWAGAAVLGIAQVGLIVAILFALSAASRRFRSPAHAAANESNES